MSRDVTSVSVTLADNQAEFMEVVFPGGGVIGSVGDVVQGSIRKMIQEIEHITHCRYVCAVSGAMRWPNSQEAWIDDNLEVGRLSK